MIDGSTIHYSFIITDISLHEGKKFSTMFPTMEGKKRVENIHLTTVLTQIFIIIIIIIN